MPDGKIINQSGNLWYGNQNGIVKDINYLKNKEVITASTRHRISSQEITADSTITLQSTSLPDYYTYQAFYCRSMTLSLSNCTIGTQYTCKLILGQRQDSEIWLHYTPTQTSATIPMTIMALPVFPTYSTTMYSICTYTFFGASTIGCFPEQERTGMVIIDSYIPWTFQLQYPSGATIKIGMGSQYNVNWFKIA